MPPFFLIVAAAVASVTLPSATILWTSVGADWKSSNLLMYSVLLPISLAISGTVLPIVMIRLTLAIVSSTLSSFEVPLPETCRE